MLGFFVFRSFLFTVAGTGGGFGFFRRKTTFKTLEGCLLSSSWIGKGWSLFGKSIRCHQLAHVAADIKAPTERSAPFVPDIFKPFNEIVLPVWLQFDNCLQRPLEHAHQGVEIITQLSDLVILVEKRSINMLK